MARKPTFGTPDQSKAYVFPDRRKLRGLIGIVGVAVVLVLFAGDSFTKKKPFLTAGPLSKAHAIAGSECAKCHQPWHRPPDKLCVGCHDPLASVTRFGAVAHAERVKSDKPRPDREPHCVFCHTEHRGPATPIAAVQDEACSTCHGFRSFGSGHPEFRPLKDGFHEQAGIKFNHKRHIKEIVGEKRGKPLGEDEAFEASEAAGTCESCHKSALSNGDFETISFDADCARCHFDKNKTIGATDPVSADLVSTPEQLLEAKPAPDWILAYKDDFEERRGRISKKTLHHRDAWILYNVKRLTAALEGAAAPTGGAPTAGTDTAAEIDARRAEMADLDRQITMLRGKKSVAKLQARLAQINAQEARLSGEIEQLDKRILEAVPETAAPAPAIRPGELKPALDGIDDAVALIASVKEPWAREEAAKLRAMRGSIAVSGEDVGPGWSRYNLDQRKARLSGLLDSLKGAPVAAKHELGSLEASAAPAADAGPPLTEDQRRSATQEIDAALAVISGSDAPWAREEIKSLRAKRERIATGDSEKASPWSPSEVAERKEDAAGEIEDLSRVGAAEQAIASMKHDLETVSAASGPAGSEIASLRPERERKAATLSKLRGEAKAINASMGKSQVDEGRIAGLEERKHQVKDEIQALEQLQSHPVAGTPLGGADADAIRKTAERLVKPCLKCHVENGLGIGVTAPARGVLHMATFSHDPHLKVATCLDCHEGITASEKAEDVSFAGVAKCRDCHRWGGTEARCRTCHTYHPAPVKPVVAEWMKGGPRTEAP